MVFFKVLIISGDITLDEGHVRRECCKIVPQVLLSGLAIDSGTDHDDLVNQWIHDVRLIHTVAVFFNIGVICTMRKEPRPCLQSESLHKTIFSLLVVLCHTGVGLGSDPFHLLVLLHKFLHRDLAILMNQSDSVAFIITNVRML